MSIAPNSLNLEAGGAGIQHLYFDYAYAVFTFKIYFTEWIEIGLTDFVSWEHSCFRIEINKHTLSRFSLMEMIRYEWNSSIFLSRAFFVDCIIFRYFIKSSTYILFLLLLFACFLMSFGWRVIFHPIFYSSFFLFFVYSIRLTFTHFLAAGGINTFK